MATTKRPTDVHLYKQFRVDNTDHAAFETLYRRYYPPNGNRPDRKDDNLVDWAQYEKGINGFDADDIVADCWADLTINQPDIRRCFSAFVYQKLDWLIGDYWEKRRWPEKRKSPENQDTPEQQKTPEEKFWLMPWRAKSNYFLPLDDKPFPITVRAENTAALQDERIKARQYTYFLDLAIMREAIGRLPKQEQQTIELHRLKDLTLEQAAKAAGTSFARFRTRDERALKHLCSEFFRIKYKTETLEDQTKLLSQWGDIRPDHHWVPDDENQECDCSACEKIRRDIASLRSCAAAAAPELVIAPSLNVTLRFTDRDGYKLPGQKTQVTFFGFGGGACQELDEVA